MSEIQEIIICPSCGRTNHKWTQVYYTDGAMSNPAKGVYITHCHERAKYCIVYENEIDVKYGIVNHKE